MSGSGSRAELFEDGKADGAMRTIGELSAALNIKPHVLRYWEQQFPMLQPLKRSGGRRLYRPEDITLVARIDELVNRRGYTLRGARREIESAVPEQETGGLQPRDSDILVELRAIRSRLASALAV